MTTRRPARLLVIAAHVTVRGVPANEINAFLAEGPTAREIVLWDEVSLHCTNCGEIVDDCHPDTPDYDQGVTGTPCCTECTHWN